MLKRGILRLGTAGAIVVALPFIANGLYARDVVFPPPLEESGFRPFDQQRAELGQLLFYDKVLSGNRNISCGTCHHHDLGTGDGLSLGIGEGGVGLGPDRIIPAGEERPRARVPRNAPPMFNLGHESVTILFHDGRISDDDVYGSGFNTPAEEWLPPGLQSVVAAQALFPLIAEVEMLGDKDENDIAAARNRRMDQGWPLLVERLVAIPEYVDLFTAAFDDIDGPGDINIVHVGNAIDDFVNSEWRSFDSPFDRFLEGDPAALNEQQRRGADLFYGAAGCVACHSGPLLTDDEFRALAIPPFGPGRIRRFDPYARDVGRVSETDLSEDFYRFRTPSLRNVADTGPWGHNGAYGSLEAIIRHHMDPLAALDAYDRTQAVLPEDASFAAKDYLLWEDSREMERYRRFLDRPPVQVSGQDLPDLIAFLESLSDPIALEGRLGVPDRVPSGLPVDRMPEP